MKIKITLAAGLISLIMLVPQLSYGQFRSFVLGIKAAPALCWMNTTQKDYSSNGMKLGFTWGAAAEFYFAKNYALATGLNFQYLGGKLTYPDLKEDVTVTLNRDYRIRYIEVPAVLKLKTNEMGGLKYFGQLGLGMGIRINSKAKEEYDLNNKTTSIDYVSIDGDTRLFRASMILGVGVEYPFDSNTSGVFSVNFNNGFTNALKDDNVITHDKSIGKPNFIEFSFGVMF